MARRPRKPSPRKPSPRKPGKPPVHSSRPVNALDLSTLIEYLQEGTHTGTITSPTPSTTLITITKAARRKKLREIRSRPRFIT